MSNQDQNSQYIRKLEKENAELREALVKLRTAIGNVSLESCPSGNESDKFQTNYDALNGSNCGSPDMENLEKELCKLSDITNINDISSDEENQKEKTKRGLEIEENVFRNIVQNIPVMIHAHNENMEYVFWNQESERITGYSADEIILNPRAFELLKCDFDETGLESMNAKTAALEKNASYKELEVPVKCADGSIKIIAWTNVSELCPIKGWFMWEIGRDVTHEVESRKKLRESEQRARQIFQLCPDPIFLHKNGRCLFANPAGNVIFGFSEIIPMLNLPISEIFYNPPESWQRPPSPTPSVEDSHELVVRATGHHLEVHSTTIYLHGEPTILTIARNITDRKNFENNILNSRNISRSLIDSTNDLLALLDRDFKIIACNTSFASITEKHPRSIVMQTYSNVVPERLFESTVPLIKECQKRKNKVSAVVFYKKKILDVVVWPILDEKDNIDYIALAMHDATLVVNANQEKIETEFRYKTVFDNAHDVIFIIDTDCKFLEVNPALENILKHPEISYINANLLNFTCENASSNFFQHFRSLPTYFNASLSFKDASGGIYSLEINASRIKYQNKIGYLCIGRDLTEWKKTADMLKKAKKFAEDNNRLKDEFVANISHELRTPLSSIIGIADILLNESLSAQQKDYVYKVSSTADVLLKLINDLLDISRIESETFSLSFGTFNLDSIISSVKDAFSYALAEKNLVLKYSIDKIIPSMIVGDSLRILQVVYNLIANAIKFTKQGTITLEVKEDTSFTPSKGEEDLFQLLFSVTDTGIGIESEELDLIFERFYQAGSFLSKEHSGTGLGLFISRKLVERMGGTIWVNSTVGSGTSFFFTVKLRKSDGSQIADGEFTESKEVILGKSLRVLVVEDNALYRSIISELIRSDGHIVFIASDGLEALSLLDTELVDVVLLDLQMPKCDGFQTTKMIRENKDKRVAEIPIIALSAHAQKDYQAKCVEAGMNSYISKPIRHNQLRQELAKFSMTSRSDQYDAFCLVGSSELNGKEGYSYLNLDTLKNHVGESQDMLGLSCSKFLDYSEKYMEDISNALVAGNRDEIKSLAHSYKSIASTFGCNEAHAISEQLEKNCHEQEWSEIESLILAIKDINNCIQQDVRCFLKDFL